MRQVRISEAKLSGNYLQVERESCPQVEDLNKKPRILECEQIFCKIIKILAQNNFLLFCFKSLTNWKYKYCCQKKWTSKLVVEDIFRCMRATLKDMRGNFYGGSHHHYQVNQLERQLPSPHHYYVSLTRAKVSEQNCWVWSFWPGVNFNDFSDWEWEQEWCCQSLANENKNLNLRHF